MATLPVSPSISKACEVGSELALARLTIERSIAHAEFGPVVRVQWPLGTFWSRHTSLSCESDLPF